MSQNAILDRETITTASGATETVAPLGTATPHARAQREHLTLVAWDATAPATLAQFAPVRPVRRSRFGWTEAGVGLLMLASGAAALASLLHLQ